MFPGILRFINRRGTGNRHGAGNMSGTGIERGTCNWRGTGNKLDTGTRRDSGPPVVQYRAKACKDRKFIRLHPRFRLAGQLIQYSPKSAPRASEKSASERLRFPVAGTLRWQASRCVIYGIPRCANHGLPGAPSMGSGTRQPRVPERANPLDRKGPILYISKGRKSLNGDT